MHLLQNDSGTLGHITAKTIYAGLFEPEFHGTDPILHHFVVIIQLTGIGPVEWNGELLSFTKNPDAPSSHL